MSREVPLYHLVPLLQEFAYPCPHDRAVEHGRDVTLVLADGTVNLGDIIAESTEDAFESPDDLLNEVMTLLPRRAVGEPYQSEGEG